MEEMGEDSAVDSVVEDLVVVDSVVEDLVVVVAEVEEEVGGEGEVGEEGGEGGGEEEERREEDSAEEDFSDHVLHQLASIYPEHVSSYLCKGDYIYKYNDQNLLPKLHRDQH
jgi:hypothetical protein